MTFLDLDLARRVERAEAANLKAYGEAAAHLYPHLRDTVLEVDGATVLYAGNGSVMTQIAGLGMAAPVDDETLDRVCRFYGERTAAFEIRVCPFAHSSLVTQCNARSYRMGSFEQCWTGTPDRLHASGEARGVDVREVGPDDVGLWAETVARGFTEKDHVDEAGLQLTLPFTAAPGARCFLATVDGEPAGGGALFVADGVALLYAASTRPTYRKRGVQTALLSARIQAAAGGCDLVSVTTTPGSGSARNVERAGFTPTYTWLSVLAAVPGPGAVSGQTEHPLQ